MKRRARVLATEQKRYGRQPNDNDSENDEEVGGSDETADPRGARANRRL